MNHQIIRWGIIGPGRIAEKFARDISFVKNTEIVAVASRNPERARHFADEFRIAHFYDDYKAIAGDPDVDAVYVATPHPMHFENTKMCLNAGKHVLCEKPLTVNTAESKILIDLATEKDLFLMEALWSRFLPVLQEIRQWINNGRIGDIRLIQSTFGFQAPYDPLSRIFSPELAGGALLDIGVYPIAVSQFLMKNNPLYTDARAIIGNTGVDEMIAVNLLYADGAVSQFTASVQAWFSNDCTIYGTLGKIHIEPMFWYPAKATIYSKTEEQTIHRPLKGGGFEYEIEETCRCIRENMSESPLMTHADTLANMRLMDTIRNTIGLKYPFEK